MFKKYLLSFAMLLVLALFGAACASPAATSGAPRTITVSGTGQSFLTPDIAYVTIGVRVENEDMSMAVEASNTQTEALIAALKKAGVAEKDLQTSNFNVYSWEDYREFYEGKPPIIYSVENTVYVTVRDLTSLGDLLGVAIDAGANNIWGIQFDASDKSAAMTEAREAAVEIARNQASEMAGFTEVVLGEIVSINVYSSGYAVPYGQSGYGGGGADYASEAASAVPIAPGALTITADVTLVFEIK